MAGVANPFDIVAWCRSELDRVRDELGAAESDPDCRPDTIEGYKQIIAKLEELILRHSI
jgi:hypothetical protein